MFLTKNQSYLLVYTLTTIESRIHQRTCDRVSVMSMLDSLPNLSSSICSIRLKTSECILCVV